MSAQRVALLTAEREFDAAVVRPAYEGSYGPFSWKVTVIERPQGRRSQLLVIGQLRDAEGVVGRFHRQLYHFDGERWVDHKLLYLKRRARGQGLAQAFNAQAEQHYRAWDMQRIDVAATKARGGYYWATQGFEFSGRDEAARAQQASMLYDSYCRARVETLIRQGRMQPHELETLDARLYDPESLDIPEPGADAPPAERITSITELRDLGRDREWLTASGERMWPGKYLLLGSSWSGSKHLRPPRRLHLRGGQ